MRVAVIGSRKCDNISVDDIIGFIPSNCSEIISGGADGIDSLAADAAKKLGIKLTEFLPDYNRFGKAAPLARNTTIIKNSDYILAFWDYQSTGTRFVITECIKNNVPCKIIEIDENGVVFKKSAENPL